MTVDQWVDDVAGEIVGVIDENTDLPLSDDGEALKAQIVALILDRLGQLQLLLK